MVKYSRKRTKKRKNYTKKVYSKYSKRRKYSKKRKNTKRRQRGGSVEYHRRAILPASYEIPEERQYAEVTPWAGVNDPRFFEAKKTAMAEGRHGGDPKIGRQERGARTGEQDGPMGRRPSERGQLNKRVSFNRNLFNAFLSDLSKKGEVDILSRIQSLKDGNSKQKALDLTENQLYAEKIRHSTTGAERAALSGASSRGKIVMMLREDPVRCASLVTDSLLKKATSVKTSGDSDSSVRGRASGLAKARSPTPKKLRDKSPEQTIAPEYTGLTLKQRATKANAAQRPKLSTPVAVAQPAAQPVAQSVAQQAAQPVAQPTAQPVAQQAAPRRKKPPPPRTPKKKPTSPPPRVEKEDTQLLTTESPVSSSSIGRRLSQSPQKRRSRSRVCTSFSCGFPGSTD
jgi:hypothetical protein